MRRYVIDIDFSCEQIVRYIETFEQTFYPVFFLEKTDVGLHLGYGEKEKEYSEFLDILIDTKHKVVTVERDLKATLILFYYYKDARLIISSDYNYFAQHLDLPNIIDRNWVKLFLGHGRSARGTICKDISFLYPRKKYHFTQYTFEVTESSYTSKPIQIEDILYQNFCHLNQYNKVGAEISGGKDSAFLPILSKKSTFFPFCFVSGQLHNGPVGEQQRQTLEKVLNFLELPYEYHQITEDDYPLKSEPIGVIRHPLEEIYKNSLLGEIAILKKHGINTIFNGFGGDEVFESKISPHDFIEKDDVSLQFIFQKKFIEEVHELNNSTYIYEDGLFQTSVYESLISRNNLYIQHGIRPMTPYLNLDVYEYFQSLRVSKKEFFTTFYNMFDSKLQGAFDTNTNMAPYFMGYFKSDYFNNLLQSSVEFPTWIHNFYCVEHIRTHFLPTFACSEELVDTYDFLLYKFVVVSLMLR